MAMEVGTYRSRSSRWTRVADWQCIRDFERLIFKLDDGTGFGGQVSTGCERWRKDRASGWLRRPGFGGRELPG